MTFWKWSVNPASNTNSDMNWAEGQAPSTVNDSARAMMAALAKWREDIGGGLASSGTNDYVVTSQEGYLGVAANMNNKIICFTPTITNTGACRLNVDGTGLKHLRGRTSVALDAGVLIAGTPYMAKYDNATGEWLLHNFLGFTPADTTSYVQYVPIGGMVDYAATTITPAANWKFCNGQSLAKATYTTLNALLSAASYPYGSDVNNFFLPDFRGRVAAGLDTMGGTASQNRLTGLADGVNADNLGAFGGLETTTLTETQLPAHDHPITDVTHAHTYTAPAAVSPIMASGPNNTVGGSTPGTSTSSVLSGINTTQNAGGGAAHNNVQPTLICTKIMRVL